MFNKENYWKRREAGLRGQEGHYMRKGSGMIVGRDTTKHEKPGSGVRAMLRPLEVHGRGRRRRAEIARVNEIHARQMNVA